MLPNPVKSGGNASGYMDLISDSTRTPCEYLTVDFIELEFKTNIYSLYISTATATTPSTDVKFLPEFVPEFVPAPPPVATIAPKNVGLDNPEYHMMNGAATTQLNGALPNNHPPVRRKTNSSDDDTDHEYYNDYDKLKRELQPLYQRRSETTV